MGCTVPEGSNAFLKQKVWVRGTLQVQIAFSVTVGGPFGLVGTIEKAMLTKGKESVELYVRYCKQYLTRLRSLPKAGLDEADTFYDATDQPLPSPGQHCLPLVLS
jgi:hypothetical protein